MRIGFRIVERDERVAVREVRADAEAIAQGWAAWYGVTTGVDFYGNGYAAFVKVGERQLFLKEADATTVSQIAANKARKESRNASQ